MNIEDLQRLLRERCGLRVEREMSMYIQRRLDQGGDAPIPVMGGEARTGRPVRRVLPRHELLESPTPTQPQLIC